MIYVGSTVRLRLTSSNDIGTSYTATLTIGTVSTSWTVTSLACPANFAFIPGSAGVDSFGNADANYSGGWCVSQYTMSPYETNLWVRDGANGWHFHNSTGIGKKVTARGGAGSFPITQVTRDEASDACANDLLDKDGNAVTDGKLVTAYFWSMIGEAIVSDAINWSGANPGDGNMSRGNASSAGPLEGLPEGTEATKPTAGTFYYTTAQGRAWRMGLNGDTVYDWAGNVWEWYDDLHNNSAGAAWKDIDNATLNFSHANPNGLPDISVLPSDKANITTAKGVGRIYVNDSVSISGSTHAAFFGGRCSLSEKSHLRRYARPQNAHLRLVNSAFSDSQA
jgi:hypothetical protein